MALGPAALAMTSNATAICLMLTKITAGERARHRAAHSTDTGAIQSVGTVRPAGLCPQAEWIGTPSARMPGMRTALLICASVAFLGACAERDFDLRGTLGDGWPDEALFASVGADLPPSLIENGAFTFSDVPAGPVDLRISAGEEEIARIDLRDIPGGATLSLDRIRFDRKREFAFPAAVQMDGADVVTVNGIRHGNAKTLTDRVAATGAVLAISEDADALIFRPRSERLPDLPVVITPATLVTDGSGNVASLEQVSAGDSVRVEGRTDSGYLFAERITLGGAPDEKSSSTPAGHPPGGRGSMGTRTEVREQEQVQSPEPARVWNQQREQERKYEKRDEKEDKKKAKRDEKRSKERDEGRHGSERRRVDIPKGHLPPPGECRDWIPGLPPGQQPPPRQC